MEQKNICQYEKCKKEFTFTTKNHRKKMYCSSECKTKADIENGHFSNLGKHPNDTRHFECHKYNEKGELLEKRCYVCKKWLSPDQFFKQKGLRSNLQAGCKRCGAIKALMKTTFASREIAELLYDKKLSCEVCGSFDNVCGDHCHETKTYRGALCRICNAVLGLTNEDQKRLHSLANYLERHKEVF